MYLHDCINNLIIIVTYHLLSPFCAEINNRNLYMTLYIFYEVNTSKVHCAIILIEYI